jgi:hypothetical protein
MTCSDAIKEIIKTAASDYSNLNSSSLKVGSKSGPSGLNKPDCPLDNFDDQNWDKGSEDSKIVYTSPANSNCLYDLEYVLSGMKSSDNAPIVFGVDRYLKNIGRQWFLKPLTDYFKKAKENQIERLFIGDTVNSTKPYINRGPLDAPNFQSPIASRILSYELVPMSCVDDNNLTHTPIHSFDYTQSQFNIEFEGNKITDLLDNFKGYAQQGLYSYQSGKQLLLNVNKTKQTGLMLNNKFVPRSIYPKGMSSIKMAKNFFYLNQTIYFQIYGLPIRTPGKFIFIDRETSNGEKNPFDDKALGQWMMTNVIHSFSKDFYVNEVIAQKVDVFSSWFSELDKDAGIAAANAINILNTA